MKKIRKETIIYEGLGFPIRLINAPVRELFGETILDINLGKFQRDILKAMIYKKQSLTGLEVKFIRKYFEMTTTIFGKAFGVTHAAVLKWESEQSRLPPTTELCIRLFILDKLQAKNDEFGKLYHMVSVESLTLHQKSGVITPLEYDVKQIQAIA